jgi:cholesterol oxidase
VIGDSVDSGVLDPYHRVWNYPTLHIVDGASVTANLGVNPSLTITAQAERAISMWPNKGGMDPRPIQGQPYKKVGMEFPSNPVVPAGAVGELKGDI